MASEHVLATEIMAQGKKLGFDVEKEVEASESAWVDIVWFDKRLPIAALKPGHQKMRYAPVLPIVGFEVELKTGLNAKHVKGSVANLNNLGAQLGIIVIGSANLLMMKQQPAHSAHSDKQIQKVLRDRIYRWVYAEAQPRSRIILMFETEVTKWFQGLENHRKTSAVTAPGTSSPVTEAKP